MVNRTHITVGQIAEIYGVPAWKIRRVVDSIGADIPRIGLYRCVPRDLLGAIAAELQRQGWFPVLPQEAAGL